MFEQNFEAMLRQYLDAIDDKRKFTGLIKDFFPEQEKNINLLLMAYNLGIAQDIQNIEHITNTFAFKYVKQLTDKYGLSRANADWVVTVWCICYGEKVLGKANDIKLNAKSTGPSIEEKQSGVVKYDDLFEFKKGGDAGEYSVSRFNGTKKDTIIFPNKYANKSVVEIGEGSFENELVEEAILTDGYERLCKRAFAYCSKLHQVVMPISVKTIMDEAFMGCESLKSVALPENLEDIGTRAFANSGLRTISFPKYLYGIGAEAFAGCKDMTQIRIPQNIETIPDGMFMECESLTKVELHESLTEIGKNAFNGCKSLQMIIIPDSVKSIGENAFAGTDKQFIIQCSFGSYAEEYARKNKIKYQLV